MNQAILIILVAAWVITSAIAAGHAVMFKRDPRSSAIWFFVSLLLPLIGPSLYWSFGINRVERRAIEHLGRRGRPFSVRHIIEAHRTTRQADHTMGHLEALQSVADRVTRLPLLRGNKIEPLHNGEQAYPRMLDAIGDAKESVTLASYIFDRDEVGRDFADALENAASHGVRVHVLVDGIGTLGTLSRMGRRLLRSGAAVAAFFPLRFPFGRFRINLRNHRKILVVDGRTGFTGGMNISQRHLLSRPASGRVEDLHFQITGPVVAELQHVFVEDWLLSTGSLLEGEAYFPKLRAVGPAICRGVPSGPDENFEVIHWLLKGALAAAQRTVHIVTPYFVPSPSLISAMNLAAMQGIRVKLLLPSVVDRRFMRWVADAYLWQLLEHGVEIYRRPPPFVHTKLMIVDERWSLIGSANWDPRSFRLNFEFNVEAYDPELASSLASWLDDLAMDSSRVTLEEVDARPRWRRLRDGFVKMASPYL